MTGKKLQKCDKPPQVIKAQNRTVRRGKGCSKLVVLSKIILNVTVRGCGPGSSPGRGVSLCPAPPSLRLIYSAISNGNICQGPRPAAAHCVYNGQMFTAP